MNKHLEKERLAHVSSQDSTTLKPKSFIPKSLSTLTKDDCHSWQNSSNFLSITDPRDDFSSLQSDRIRLIGQRARVAGVKEGIVRYFGPVQFAEGCWCGIELDEPIGKNDGSVQGTRYFSCEQNFGIFAPIRKVETVFSLKDPLISYRNVEESQHSRPYYLTEQLSSDFKFSSTTDKSQNLARSWNQSSNTNSSQIHNNLSVMMQHVSSSVNICKSSEDKSSQFSEETIPQYSISTTFNKHERAHDRRLLTDCPDSDILNRNDSEQGNNDQKSNEKVTPSSEDNDCSKLNEDIQIIPSDKQNYEIDSFYIDYHVENPLSSQSYYMFDSETFDSDDDSKQDLSLDDLQQQQMSFDLGGILKDDNDDFDGGFWADQEDSLGILTPNQMKDFTVISEQHTSKVSDLDAVTLPKTFSCDEVSELPDSEIVEDVTVEYDDEVLQNSSLSTNNCNIPAHRPYHICASSYVPQNSTPVERVCHDSSSNISKSTILPPGHHNVSFSSVSFASSSIKEREISYLLSGLQAENCWKSSDHVNFVADDVLSSNKWTTVYRNNAFLKQIDYDKPIAPNTHESTKIYSDLRYSNDPIVEDSNFLKIKMGKASETHLEQQVNSLVAAQPDTDKDNNVCVNDKTLSGIPGDLTNNILPKDDEIINPKEKYHGGTLKNMVLEDEKQEYVESCLLTKISENYSLPVDSKYSPSKTRCKEQELMRINMMISKEEEYSKKVRKDREESKLIEAVFRADEEMENEESGLGTLTSSGEEACMKFSTYSQDSGVASDGHESERQLKTGSMTDSDLFTDGGLGTSIAESESEHSGESKSYRQNYKDFYRLTQDDVCPEHHKSTDKIRFQTEGHQDISVPFPDKMDIKWEAKLTRVPEESISNSNSCSVSSPEETEKKHVENENILKQENVDEIEDMPKTDKFPQMVVSTANEKISSAEEKDKNIYSEAEPLTTKTNKNVEHEILTKTNRKWEKSEKSNGNNNTTITHCEKKTKYTRKNAKSKIKEIFEKPKGGDGDEEKKLVSRTLKKNRWDAVTTKIAASLDEDKSKPKKKEVKSKINTNLVAARQIAKTKSSNLNSEDLKHLVGKERSTRRRHFTNTENKTILQSQRGNVILKNDVTVCKTSKTTADRLWTPTRSVQLQYNFDQENITRYQVSSTASPSSEISSTSFVFRTPSQKNIGGRNAVVKTISTVSSITSKKKNLLKSNTSGKTYGQVTTPTEPLKRTTNLTNQTLKSSKRPATKTASLSSSRTTSCKKKETSVEKGRQTTDHRKNQEYVQEIQRLGALCETRTKELNLLKMQLKHAILGFDSFCVIVKYLTEELANPRIVTELKKTKDDLHKIEIQLRCYETQLEHLKKSNAEEIQELTITLTEAHKEKIEMLVLAHQEELRSLKANHEKEVQDLKSIHVQSMKDTQIRNNSSVDSLREQHNRLIKDLERDFVNQLHQTMEDHKKVQASLKQQLKELRKHCKDLQQEKKQMEGTLQQDTSTKLQWVLAQKSTLQKEVDSLRIVLELKTTEMHQLRKDNLEMKKELEKLPIAEKKIEILRRRNEDLQALIDEKVQVERQLTSESQQLKEEFEKESKMNSRLSMEKEELQWKLKQTMEASVLLSTMTDSSSNVLDKLLQDDSLLRSPVRMSVYLNEHDTSPSNGERNSFPRPLSTGRLTPNNSSSGEKCHSSASRRSSSKAKVKRSKQLESSSETPNLSHLSNLPTQKENELDYGSYTDNNGVKHVMNSNFLAYDPESHTLDSYELPIDKRISGNNQVLTETASFKEYEYEDDHSNQDMGLNHQNVSSSSQKTLDDVPDQDLVIKQTDNEEDGLTDSQGSFLQESTQTENLCPESMTSSSCSWSSAADNGQVKEMWMAFSSADLAFSEQSSDGNETNQYKTSDLEHIQRRAGYQTGKCSPRYFAGEAMSQVKSIGSVCHKTTGVENLDGNLKHTTDTTSK